MKIQIQMLKALSISLLVVFSSAHSMHWAKNAGRWIQKKSTEAWQNAPAVPQVVKNVWDKTPTTKEVASTLTNAVIKTATEHPHLTKAAIATPVIVATAYAGNRLRKALKPTEHALPTFETYWDQQEKVHRDLVENIENAESNAVLNTIIASPTYYDENSAPAQAGHKKSVVYQENLPEQSELMPVAQDPVSSAPRSALSTFIDSKPHKTHMQKLTYQLPEDHKATLTYAKRLPSRKQSVNGPAMNQEPAVQQAPLIPVAVVAHELYTVAFKPEKASPELLRKFNAVIQDVDAYQKLLKLYTALDSGNDKIVQNIVDSITTQESLYNFLLQKDENGNTPLHRIVMNARGRDTIEQDEKVVKLLLSPIKNGTYLHNLLYEVLNNNKYSVLTLSNQLDQWKIQSVFIKYL